MSKIIIFNKPYGVLSQFTDCDNHPGLRHFIEERGFYPAGRLDRDSEGLLILTDDGSLQASISSPRHKRPKTYWVQVEGQVEKQHLLQLSSGVELKEGRSLPAQAREIDEPLLWPRTPAVRFRKSIPTTWLELIIYEGRNRQVRRMTAAVGLPTLRLVRWAVANWTLAGLAPGEYRLEEVDPERENRRPTQKALHRHAR